MINPDQCDDQSRHGVPCNCLALSKRPKASLKSVRNFSKAARAADFLTFRTKSKVASDWGLLFLKISRSRRFILFLTTAFPIFRETVMPSR